MENYKIIARLRPLELDDTKKCLLLLISIRVDRWEKLWLKCPPVGWLSQPPASPMTWSTWQHINTKSLIGLWPCCQVVMMSISQTQVVQVLSINDSGLGLKVRSVKEFGNLFSNHHHSVNVWNFECQWPIICYLPKKHWINCKYRHDTSGDGRILLTVRQWVQLQEPLTTITTTDGLYYPTCRATGSV